MCIINKVEGVAEWMDGVVEEVEGMEGLEPVAQEH